MSSSIAGLRVSTVHNVSAVMIGALRVSVPNASECERLTLTGCNQVEKQCSRKCVSDYDVV